MTTRSARKQKTRQRIIDAALEKIAEEENFAATSMREVAKAAGIAPTSFYRHFNDFNELGLALVSEAALSLRQLQRQTHDEVTQSEKRLLRVSVERFIAYVRENPELFRFFLRARISGSEEIRKAVNKEVNLIIREAAEDIETFGSVKRRPVGNPKVIADAMITLLFSSGAKVLDLDEEELPFVIEVILQQLRMLFLGAELLTKRAERIN